MFAIDRLHAFTDNDDTRMSVLEPGMWLQKCAILELADKLRLLEGDVRDLAGKVEANEPVDKEELDAADRKVISSIVARIRAQTPEPFRVKGDGIYANRDGREASVKMKELADGPYVAANIMSPAFMYRYDGRLFSQGKTGDDLVAYIGPLPAKQPEQKRITGWMNLFASRYPRDGTLIQGSVLCSTREDADRQPSAARRVACVHIDVPEGGGIERGDGK